MLFLGQNIVIKKNGKKYLKTIEMMLEKDRKNKVVRQGSEWRKVDIDYYSL